MTELGHLILPHLEAVIVSAGAAEQVAAGFLKLERANLSVDVMCTIAPVQSVSFLGRFRADNPSIDATLLEAVPKELAELLAKGKIDVAIMAKPNGFQEPFHASELHAERFVVACSAGHKFAE